MDGQNQSMVPIIITSYTVFSCSEAKYFNPAGYNTISLHYLEWKQQKDSIKNECVLLSNLAENTVYYFMVKPVCGANNMSGLNSDASDPIQTGMMIIPSKPSCLRASNVAHDSV